MNEQDTKTRQLLDDEYDLGFEDGVDEGYEMGFDAAKDFISEFILSLRNTGCNDSMIISQLENFCEDTNDA